MLGVVGGLDMQTDQLSDQPPDPMGLGAMSFDLPEGI